MTVPACATDSESPELSRINIRRFTDYLPAATALAVTFREEPKQVVIVLGEDAPKYFRTLHRAESYLLGVSTAISLEMCNETGAELDYYLSDDWEG